MNLKDSWAKVGKDFVTLGKDLGKSVLRTVGVVTAKLDEMIENATREAAAEETPAETTVEEAPVETTAEEVPVPDEAKTEE